MIETSQPLCSDELSPAKHESVKRQNGVGPATAFDIKQAIQNELRYRIRDLTVSVDDGAVVLRGTVTSLMVKDLAERAALDIVHPVFLINQIERR